jgi:hypothetical protein
MSGTSAPIAGTGAVAQPAEIPQEEFLHHMTSMQQQYRAVGPPGAQPFSPYVLPAHLTVMAIRTPVLVAAKPVGFGMPAPAAQMMAEALREQNERTLAFINSHRDAMLKAIAAAQGSRGTQAFTQQMDALRDRAKADHEARIDAMFARLTAIGTAHPPTRPIILSTGNKVAGFVAGVTAEAAKVAATVRSAAAAGGTAIGKAAQAVGNWASGAAQSVGHFFSGLF